MGNFVYETPLVQIKENKMEDVDVGFIVSRPPDWLSRYLSLVWL